MRFINRGLYLFLTNVEIKCWASFYMNDHYYFEMERGSTVIVPRRLYDVFKRQQTMGVAG